MDGDKQKWIIRMKPLIAVVFLQFGLAGMDVLSKAALNKGMSNYVFVVYRHAVAFVVIAPFAVILDKLEKIKMKSIRSQAKVAGTLATVAGAMVMTLIKGPVLELFGKHGSNSHNQNSGGANLQHAIKGSVMITIGCFSAACFMILQATTLETYPAELSLTAWICLLGTIEGGIVALVMERGNPSVWSLNWDTKLLAAVYSGIVCSGMAYYIQGVVMKVRGPVFVTTFNPLCMVIVAIMGYFFLAEQMYLGRLVGAIVIILGLYLVVWGKSKDYDSPSPTIKENILPAKQTVDESNGKEEDSNYEVITLNNSGAGNKDRDEQV
ncbi:WAT1-related protein At2g37450-like isoform X5 [Gastrolobium bilobum]|uniref:WAT1-related protein At2g37450-like isoform X5 n=1 Tax=Gastrolobium bilobum TaxID=150636 RepID=UPI002AAFCEC7|nr:WAT1-related protein At2g37450-like isoform X5 [Gastrolobium bilobum]